MPIPPTNIFVNAVAPVSSAGIGVDDTRKAVFSNDPDTMTIRSDIIAGRNLCYGSIENTVTAQGLSRTETLLDACLAQSEAFSAAVEEFGAHRVAVILGASTSGMLETEQDMLSGSEKSGESFSIDVLNLSDPAKFVADKLGVTGPAYTVSNACSSGAMAIASAARLLACGMADAVITGGVDGWSRFTTEGFAALGAVSDERCRPFGAKRCGINLGEGGALVLLTRKPSRLRLAGWAETSDAHHISAPDPQATQAVRCMREAIEMAGLAPGDIDFVSLHGTATEHNDAMESKAVNEVFGPNTPVASLKPFTGHTLAGAGALQAAFAWCILCDNEEGILPCNRLDCDIDPELAEIDLVRVPRKAASRPRAVLANTFAFGGSNASLVFTAHEPDKNNV